MPYQLPPPCHPQFFKYFKSIYLSINPSSSIFFCQSINRPLPFPKYQYLIAADPGAGIGPYLDLKSKAIKFKQSLVMATMKKAFSDSLNDDMWL